MKNTTLRKLLSGFSAIALVCLALSSVSQAAHINHGDFDDIVGGGTVAYTDVTESSPTDPVPLYGAPSVSVNDLNFVPIGFGATASGGGIDITDGNLSFGLEAEPGTAIGSLDISEFGAYTLLGSGTASTQAFAAAIGFLTITEVDGVGITPFTISDSFVVNFDLVADGPAILSDWSGALSFDLGAALAAEGISATLGVTKAEYVMNNQLIAFSEAGTLSFVDKKDVGISVGPIIPEPTSMILALVAALGGVGFSRRR